MMMFDGFSTSWVLVKASAKVLTKDKALLLFPVISSLSALIVAASFILPALGVMQYKLTGTAEDIVIGGLTAWLFLFYFTMYFIIFFFNTALVGAAMIRLRGGKPSISDGLDIAYSRLKSILVYSLIAATVGMALRVLEHRSEWLGKIAAAILGAAWTMSSFMVVPILVSRDINAVDALKESASLLKKTWGENAVGQFGIHVFFSAIHCVVISSSLFIMMVGLDSRSPWLAGSAIVVGVGLFLLTLLIQSALSAVYSAVLYRYSSGESSPGIDDQLLAQAFAPKG
jgi:Family of unknown function (DUF6159)